MTLSGGAEEAGMKGGAGERRGKCLDLHQPLPERDGNGFGAVCRAELLEERDGVLPDHCRRYAKLLRDGGWPRVGKIPPNMV